MKYLKNFNESVNSEELKDFCETYLAYLMDEDFEIEIVSEDGLKFVHISKALKDNKYQTFQWSEVKDKFLPFLKMLDRSYNLEGKGGNLVCFDFLVNHRMYNLNQVLNDNLRKGARDPTLRGIWIYNIRSKK